MCLGTWKLFTIHPIQKLFMIISISLVSKIERCALWIGFIFLVPWLVGCAGKPLNRPAVEKLQGIHVVQVATPDLVLPTFLEKMVQGGIVGGVIPAGVAYGTANSPITSPLINDFGALVSETLTRRLAEKNSWWPKMIKHEGAVPKGYVYPDGHWLRIEVYKFEIALAPLRTLFIGVRASLRPALDQGEPLWTSEKVFSGVIHGGEKIILESLPNDPTQLNRELERAADWIANAIVSEAR